MLTIRLARVGKTKQAQYRMVVADHRRAVTGRFIDVVGNVNPLTDPATVTLKKDEISDWLQKGAQPSETVRTILVRESILKAPPKAEQRPSKAPKRPDKYGKAQSAQSEAAPADADGTEVTPEEPVTGVEPPTEEPVVAGSDEESAPAEAATEPTPEPEAETPPKSSDTES